MGKRLALLFLLLIPSACSFFPFSIPPTQRFTSIHEPLVLEVHADQSWQDTGVLIQPGDVLIVHYISGLWSPWPGGGYDALGSGGDPDCDCNVIRGASHAALIAKVGESLPFLVGDDFQQKMGEGGKLYLGINDTRLTDNAGAILVRIEVLR
jgi:hypothetical protein